MGGACCAPQLGDVKDEPILAGPVSDAFAAHHRQTTAVELASLAPISAAPPHSLPSPLASPPHPIDEKHMAFGVGYERGGAATAIHKGQIFVEPACTGALKPPEIPPAVSKRKVLQGAVSCGWATVDDRREFVASLIATADFKQLDLLFVVIEYVGCLVCLDAESRAYRGTHLVHSRCHGLPVDCCAKFQDHHSWTCAWTGENRAFPCCESLAIQCRSQFINARPWCRYCGLSVYHHVGNREPVAPCSIKAENGDNFTPQKFYCDLRCPIHTCILCEEPFVKTTISHLCATCNWKQKQRSAIQRAWRSVEGINRYQDELSLYWRPPTKLISVARVITGKHGSSTVIEKEMRIDLDEATKSVQKYLETIQYRCHLCHQPFRLSHILPAQLSTAQITTLAAKFAKPTVAVPTLLERALCGFCQ